MVRVSVIPAADATLHMSDAMWLYDLRPPRELPTIDFSRTLQSRFFHPSAVRCVDYIASYRRSIGVCGFLGNACVVASLTTPHNIGQVLAVVGQVFWIPAVITYISALRLEVLALLVHQYDFWYSSCATLCTVVVMALLFSDLRMATAVGVWSGVQLSIVIDANIRRIRSVQLFNIIAIVVYVFLWSVIAFAFVDNVYDFPLVRYRGHELPAVSCVSQGVGTTLMFICRNVYRRRGILRSHAHMDVIECATYRTDLRFYSLAAIPQAHQDVQRGPTRRPEHVKTMRYAKPIGRIDARDTVLRRSTREWLSRRLPLSDTAVGKVLVMLQYTALSCFTASNAFRFLQFSSSQRIERVVHVAGFVLTLAYCGLCATHFQRKLLFELATTFDFVFLTVQVAAMHLCAFQFFRWELGSSIAVATTWMWVQWCLCLDALPPVMLRKLRVTMRVKSIAITLLSVTCVMMLYLILFTQLGTSEAYSATLWEFTLESGHHVRISWAAIYSSACVTITTFSPRHVWRAAKLDSDVLLILDGVVMYENYLRPKVRKSRHSRANTAPTTGFATSLATTSST